MRKRNSRRSVWNIGIAGAALCIVAALASFAWALDIPPTDPGYSFLPKKWKGDFQQMTERREIRVLTVYSKTFYFLDKGKQRGITYEFIKEFGEFVNKKIGSETLKVKVVFIPVKRDQLLSKLIEGYGDIAAANLTITPKRQEIVDFSIPAASKVSEVVVTHSSHPPLENALQLTGQEIYVRKSSSYYESLLQLNRMFEKTGQKPVKLTFADESFEDEDLLEMVNAALIPAVIVDSHKAQLWVKVLENIQVHEDAAVRTGGKIAWAIRKNSPQLKAVADEFIKKHKQGTLFGNMMINRYLKSTKYVKNSVSKEEMKKFNSMVDLFKLYANEYDFDYLMLGAQAYQESGLDQSKKSPAGAIGVMQLLLSTAKDRSVGIPDIHILERNIHAGTKYMRYLYDRYYKNEPMADVDKMLFCFAAYNAGPANVRKIRNKTKEMGLDPNIWFHNAEVGAARIIGRETVQYVSNIYKYYIAYKLVLDSHIRRENLKKAHSQNASQ